MYQLKGRRRYIRQSWICTSENLSPPLPLLTDDNKELMNIYRLTRRANLLCIPLLTRTRGYKTIRCVVVVKNNQAFPSLRIMSR